MAVAIRFGVVRLVVRAQESYTLGGLGACSPRKILKFRGYEIASETIFVPMRCFSEASRQSFTLMPFYPLHRSYTNIKCRLSNPVHLSAESHILCSEACETNRL